MGTSPDANGPGRTLIVTVGTSLLTNRRTTSLATRPWSGWRVGGEKGLPDLDEAAHYLSAGRKAGAEDREAHLRSACAEIHTLCALGLSPQDRLVFLHSDTREGQWCAEALCAFYRAEGFHSEACDVPAMGYDAPSFAERGLRNLLDRAFDIVHDARKAGRDVVICATGGFKAEIAYLNLLGLLADVPVCYVHERFCELVRLPRLPIRWDLSVVAEHYDFLAVIAQGGLDTGESEARWLRLYPDLWALVMEFEGRIYLSAAGELLYRAYNERQEMSALKAAPDDR